MRLEPLRAGREMSLCARPSSPVATACSRARLRRRLTMAPAWSNGSDRTNFSAGVASAAAAAGSATERQSSGRPGEGHALKRPAHSKRQHDTGQCARPIQSPVRANAANPPRQFAHQREVIAVLRRFGSAALGLRPVESERSRSAAQVTCLNCLVHVEKVTGVTRGLACGNCFVALPSHSRRGERSGGEGV